MKRLPNSQHTHPLKPVAAQLDPTILRAQQGDASAFESLYRQHSRRVYGLCLRMVSDPFEAEDLTQDVFMRLSTVAVHEFQAADAYIFRIAANLLADRARRNKVRRLHLDEHLAARGRDIDPLDPDRVSEGRHLQGKLVLMVR